MLLSSLLTYCLLCNFCSNRSFIYFGNHWGRLFPLWWFFHGCIKLLKFILCLVELQLVVLRSVCSKQTSVLLPVHVWVPTSWAGVSPSTLSNGADLRMPWQDPKWRSTCSRSWGLRGPSAGLRTAVLSSPVTCSEAGPPLEHREQNQGQWVNSFPFWVWR